MTFWTLLGLLLVSCYTQQTLCDTTIQSVNIMMQSFNTNGYKPLKLDRLYDTLNSFRSTILVAYQVCFGRIIYDPDSLFPQDISECMMGLYNASLLAAKYLGNFAKIKADIDSIAKIVFSTQNNCRPVLYYKGWTNLTGDCKDYLKFLDDQINKYDDDIIMGGNGFKYINDFILIAEKVRKFCDFPLLTKAKKWNADTCQAANNDWLYPVTDALDTFIVKEKYINVTQTFYNLYQSLYRVKDVCKISSLETQ